MAWRHGISIGVTALVVGVGSKASAQGAVRVSGTVLDSSTRQPVAGAIVTMRSGEKVFSERTDEGGVFRMPRFEPGYIRVELRRIGYERKTFGVVIPSDTALDVVMAQTARKLVPVKVLGKGEGVFGVIGRSADFTPIPGAKVLVVGSGITATTDSAGEFFVPLKHPGAYMVRVTAPGYGEEVLPIAVRKDEVVESSQLLDASDRKPLSAGLWDDFDQRLRWRPIASALVSGAELRAAGGDLKLTPAVVRSGLRPGPICLFVNGQPRPELAFTDIRPEEIRAVEVYSDQRKDEVYLGVMKEMWPRNSPPCGTGIRDAGAPGNPTKQARGQGRPKVAFIKWVVVWLK